MSMTKTQVMALLKENRNERGIENWKKKEDKTGGLKSFGIGLTQLRKLSKQIGRDPKLAQELWKSDIYDAKIIGLLIDDPKQVTREQAEEQVEELHGGMLTHVFASCDATLAKTPFAFDLAKNWMDSDDEKMWVREAMNGALMGVGKRNKKLNKAAIKAAKAIGPVDIDYGDDNSCEPLDVLKHLTSDYIKERLGT